MIGFGGRNLDKASRDRLCSSSRFWFFGAERSDNVDEVSMEEWAADFSYSKHQSKNLFFFQYPLSSKND